MLTEWEKVDPAIVIKSFKKCSIPSAFNGTEDGMLHEDDSESGTDPFADIDDDDQYDDTS